MFAPVAVMFRCGCWELIHACPITLRYRDGYCSWLRFFHGGLAGSSQPVLAERITNMMSSKGPLKWDRKKKYRGKWWPAGSPTTSYSGTIRFVDGRPRLTVNAPPVGQSVYDLHGPPVIHGELESGNKVTLWDQYEQPLLHDDRPTERGLKFHRHFSHALMGQHLGTYEEELFQYSAVQLHGLAEWSEILEPTMQDLPEDKLPQYPSAMLQIPNPNNPAQSYTVLVRVENPKRLEISKRSGTPAFINHMGDRKSTRLNSSHWE